MDILIPTPPFNTGPEFNHHPEALEPACSDLQITSTTSDDARHGNQATPRNNSSPGAQIPVYRCHLCNRSYERADHLNRHLKSHENARPYRCTKCPKSFNRADLLNRHHASHERYANSNKSLRVSRYDRVATACNGCVLSKSKCQEQKPCVRCISRNIPCDFQQSRTRLEPVTQVCNSGVNQLSYS